MKKVKYHQSQHDLKLEEFYKFKADVYSYLDNKYEAITGTYGTKFKGIQEFIEGAENKLRSLMDVKSNSELQIEEFMSKYSTKLSTLEDSFHVLANKHSGLEAAQHEMNAHMSRMKKSVQDIVRDRTITQRVELLESKIHDDFLKGHIGM
jgi:chromosome segregation ATPase